MACHCFTGEKNQAPPPMQEIMHMEQAAFPDGDKVKNATKLIAKKGFKWSEHVKPIVKTEWCQKAHFGLLMKGKMTVWMADGKEIKLEAVEGGTAYYIPPGHDAEVHEEMHAVEFGETNVEVTK